MDWMVNNVQWIFNGIGVAVLSAIVPFIVYCIRKLRKNDAVIKKMDECKSEQDTSLQAKREVFYIGITVKIDKNVLRRLVDNNNIKINILVLNPENYDLLEAYRKYRGDAYTKPLSWIHLWEFAKHKQTEIRVIDSFVPLALRGVDIDSTDNGYIWAVHFFNGAKSIDTPHAELTPKHGELFDMYKAQIKAVWERGKEVWKSGDQFPQIFDEQDVFPLSNNKPKPAE